MHCSVVLGWSHLNNTFCWTFLQFWKLWLMFFCFFLISISIKNTFGNLIDNCFDGFEGISSNHWFLLFQYYLFLQYLKPFILKKNKILLSQADSLTWFFFYSCWTLLPKEHRKGMSLSDCHCMVVTVHFIRCNYFSISDQMSQTQKKRRLSSVSLHSNNWKC